MKPLKTLLALTMFAAGPLAAGDVAYRWVDEHGVTHFSDQPPPESVQAETVPLPEYAITVTPAFSYVALLERLHALEEELDAARRDSARPQTVVVQYPVYDRQPPAVRTAVPVLHHPGLVHPPRRPPARVEDPRSRPSSFDRLFDSRRGPSDPPGR